MWMRIVPQEEYWDTITDDSGSDQYKGNTESDYSWDGQPFNVGPEKKRKRTEKEKAERVVRKKIDLDERIKRNADRAARLKGTR